MSLLLYSSIETISSQIWPLPLPKNANIPLSVDLCRSEPPLLKLLNTPRMRFMRCILRRSDYYDVTSTRSLFTLSMHIATRWVRRINLNFNYFSGTGCCCHFGGFSWNNITLCRHLFRSRFWEGWYSLFLLVTFPHKCSWSKNSPARPNPSPQSIGVLSSPVFRGKTGKLRVMVMFLITSRLSPWIVSFKVQPDLQC